MQTVVADHKSLPASGTPFVLGGRFNVRPSRRSVISVGMVLAVIALPLRGLFLATGSSMEEGFMLAFPQRILEGDIPNVDFLHLYGPFSLHVLAGWYWLFGDTLESQRVFGLLQHVGIIFAMYAIGRAWGRRTAVLSAVTALLLVLTPIGLSALAWEGGVALGLWSIVFGIRALHTSGRSRQLALIAAGLLVGFALGYRPDLVLALGLAHCWLLWRGRTGRTWKPALAGMAIGLVPFMVHLIVAGVRPSVRGMFLQPVFDLLPGR
ncbi:MAG: glycosyltransferase family 39 protein [Ilumatobacteraceae bacterium]|nr:glycosyltransferase family 39 protein [Ilumatobacteraceae bacterium]